MNKTFVELWEKHKDELREQFKKETTHTIDNYNDLVKLLIEHVINKGNHAFDINNITVIDDGDYQGSQIFLIPDKSYQPGALDYLVTWEWYGSCSGCDTLLAVVEKFNESYFSKQDIDDLMTLCLHLLQNLKYLYTKEDCVL